MSATLDEVTAIVLAGGQGRRFGGPDKLSTSIEGASLIGRALEAAAVCARILVVGPPLVVTQAATATGAGATDVVQVQESPPGGGPVAAIAAGLAHVHTSVVVVLAGDQPFAHGLPQALIAELGGALPTIDAVVPVDASGRRQPLAAAYRARALHRALNHWASVSGISARDLLAQLTVQEVASDRLPRDSLVDIDTTDDLAQAHRLVALRHAEHP